MNLKKAVLPVYSNDKKYIASSGPKKHGTLIREINV